MNTVKIIVRDEVNVKLEGLDMSTRKKLVDKFKFRIPGAQFMPAVRLGRWDGTVSFFQMGGNTYVNLLPEILEWLQGRGWDFDLVDQRNYQIDYDLEQIDENTFSDILWPDKHPAAGEPVVLRDYQVEIINKFMEDPQCVQEIATGAGKTLITAALSKKVEPHGRSIVVVPNKGLVTQTEADYVNLGLDVGVWYGDRKDWGKQHTICTWQSLLSLMKKNGDSGVTIYDFIEDVVAVVVDECLAGDTLVDIPSGKKAIKDFQPGDAIISFDEERQVFVEDTVVKLHINLPKSNSAEMYEFEMDDGSILRITGNHKMLTKRGWVEARDLTLEDEIISK